MRVRKWSNMTVPFGKYGRLIMFDLAEVVIMLKNPEKCKENSMKFLEDFTAFTLTTEPILKASGNEFDSEEDAEMQVREMDVYKTLMDCDFNICYVDEIRKRDIASEMCQDLLNLIDKKENNND